LYKPPADGAGTWGVRIGFQRWNPNADAMLKLGDREFEVEKSRGWRAVGELSGVAAWRLRALPGCLGNIRIEGGVGLFWLRQPDIFVKGYHAVGNSALNREITLEHDSQVTAGISAGFSMPIAGRIEPMVRCYHILTSDGTTSILTAGMGLLVE